MSQRECTAALERRLYLLLTTLPPRFIRHRRRFGSAPHDVNDVLSLCIMFAAKTQDRVVQNRQDPLNPTRVGWLYR